MITPRETTLFRTPDPRAFQRAIAERASSLDPARCAVVVPGQAAARRLRPSLGDLPPLLVTRDDLYGRLRDRLASPPALIGAFEREVMFRAASRQAIQEGAVPPFDLRPGLVAEIAGFYDALIRQHRTLEQFERVFVDELEANAAIDRGAERLLRQTRFLAATYRHYRTRLDASGPGAPTDEHGLRAILLLDRAPDPLRHVIVSVADRAGDAHGLWPADFDLLTRLPGLERLDVIATEATLASGFHERIREALPDIAEERSGPASTPAVLAAPEAPDGRLHFTSRDREAELADVLGRLDPDAGTDPAAPAGGRGQRARVAIVFKRPLPYLYLARQLLDAAGVPYQTEDAMPLAVEPYAAAVDLVFGAVTSGFGRTALVDLLASPHFRFADEPGVLSGREAAGLGLALHEISFLGGAGRLQEIARAWQTVSGGGEGRRERVGRAASVAAAVATELSGLAGPAPAAVLLEGLLRFLEAHAAEPPEDAGEAERQDRARAAVVAAIAELRDAFLRHDSSDTTLDQVAASLRRWIEAQTFAPRRGETGLHLTDADAARYGDFDEVHVVGLVDDEWPARRGGSVFYPGRMLRQMGWPAERDRIAGERAVFLDLLRLPVRRVWLSGLALEDEAIVSPSPFLELVGELGLAVERVRSCPPGAQRMGTASVLEARWARQRGARTPREAPRFHGDAGPRPRGSYTVTSVETYLRCPFKYFAAHVLGIDEAREDQAGMAPLERGRFVHEVLRQFFERWQQEEGGAIAPDRMDRARALFTVVADRLLETLPDDERNLERLRLLGSAASPGIADLVIRTEAEAGVAVVERLLEYPLDGEWRFGAGAAARLVRVRGKLDRLDLLADSTFRLVDYKTGRVQGRRQAVQLPIYATAAAARLAEDGRGRWTASEALYLAFGESRPTVRLGRPGADLARAIADGQERFLAAVAGIEAGTFPPRPSDDRLCETCSYAAICRKDYVQEPGTAPALEAAEEPA